MKSSAMLFINTACANKIKSNILMQKVNRIIFHQIQQLLRAKQDKLNMFMLKIKILKKYKKNRVICFEESNFSDNTRIC